MGQKKKKKHVSKASEGSKPAIERDPLYDWADHLLFSGTLLILFLRPLLSGRTYPQYTHFFNMGVALLAILWLIKGMRKGRLEVHNRLLTGFALAFLAICSFTLFTTVNKGDTLRYIYELVSYTLVFLVIANNFREPSSIKAVVITLFASGLLITVYGLVQYYFTLEMTRQYIRETIQSTDQGLLMGVPLGTGILHRLGSKRIFSTFLYPNAYGMYLGMLGALMIGWIWSMHPRMTALARSSFEMFFGRKSQLGNPTDTKGDNIEKTEKRPMEFFGIVGGLLLLPFFIILCVLVPWNLWLTYSRGALLAAAIILLVFAVVGFTGRRISRKAVALVLLCILIVGILNSAQAVPVDEVAARDVSFLSRIKDTTTVMQRFSYWKAALAMVRENPWFGVGWGAFEHAYPRYMIPGGYPVKLAHNNYLQVWAETGTIGLNAFVGLWLVFLYVFWRKVRPGAAGEFRGIACGLGAGVIGFLANSLVDFGLYLPALTYLLFAILGLLVAIPTESEKEDKFSFRLPGAVGAILIVMVCIFIVFLYRSFMGMIYYDWAETERNAAFPTEFEARRGFAADPQQQLKALKDGVSLLNKSIKYFPLGADAHHMLGDTYLKLTQIENVPFRLNEAVKQLKRAADLNPWSPYVYQSLAAAYWTRGTVTGQREDYEEAMKAEEWASQNFPINPQYHEKLAQIYNALGYKEKAKEEAESAKRLQKDYKEF